MTTQNIWDAEKIVLRGKFIAIQSYLRKFNRIDIVSGIFSELNAMRIDIYYK